ncbi:amidohydrolase [Lewinella sp. IMCC34191]|uniref:amidohydrolase n=1 Tax=Lewinella sp. IMCC34191 TaxID=2259172 RepID=UPI000E24A8EB|nr:amidohydrolase [Lewinella sp. IMCC34191]
MNDSSLQLRRELHRFPEPSGKEGATAERIRRFLRDRGKVTFLDHLGGESFAAVYDFSGPGPTVMIRCELDALPIVEANDFAYRSTVADVSHKCGHDGHMAIVCGLADSLGAGSFARGRVVLLFQAAEETGRGARQVVESPAFRQLAPDYVFALHNIPGAPLHQIITVAGSFSAEVRSFALTLTGVESHAAEPENGRNPTTAVAELIPALAALQRADPHDPGYALLTPVHLTVGQRSYGIAPGHGEVHYTVRTWTGETMDSLMASVTEIVRRTAAVHGLEHRLTWLEHFPGTRNDRAANLLVTEAAEARGLELRQRPYPFAFGEDFGWLAGRARSAMFGLGAGEHCPALHYPTYDFPDELIATGVSVFSEIIRRLLG